MTALGGPYAAAADLKRRMSIPDSSTRQDADITAALATASAAINDYCGRQFGTASSVSARSFAADRSGINTDDFSTTTGLIIGTTAYDAATTSYALLPLNGLVNGVSGWPYYRIEQGYAGLIYNDWWSAYGVANTVSVTALWGWASVPVAVTEACLLLAADDLKGADTQFGFAGYGDYVTRVRVNPRVQEKLNPYVHPSRRTMVA